MFVYKLVVADSIEEKVLALQEAKKQMVEAIYSSSEQSPLSAMNAEQMLALFDK